MRLDMYVRKLLPRPLSRHHVRGGLLWVLRRTKWQCAVGGRLGANRVFANMQHL